MASTEIQLNILRLTFDPGHWTRCSVERTQSGGGGGLVWLDSSDACRLVAGVTVACRVVRLCEFARVVFKAHQCGRNCVCFMRHQGGY